MKLSSSLSIEEILDRHPVIVTPEISVIEAIQQMNLAWLEGCDLFEEERTSDSPRSISQSRSYALVMEESHLLGLFTERDLVRLIASGSQVTETVISEVMTQQVMTLQASGAEDIFTALNLLNQHHIRHLPILDANEQLLGVVTPEAIRKVLEPTDLLRLRQVDDVMNTEVIHALPTASVLSLAQLMAHHKVSCVVIGETQKEQSQAANSSSFLTPIGIVTERDIVQFQLLELNLQRLQAQTVMSTPLFLLSPGNSLWEANQKMQQHRVRRLVVAGPKTELVGIVTQTNILQVLDPREMHRLIELLEDKVHQLERENIQLLQHRTEELEQQVNASIAEHQQAEKRVAEQAALLDITRDAIFVRGLENRILFWNQGAERLYGWTAVEAMGVKAQELFNQVLSFQLEDALNITIEEGSWNGNLTQQTKAGQEIIVESRWTLMKDEQDNPQSILVVNTDITENTLLEKQLLRTQRLESIGTLAGGIAHDLNNILTPIMGIARLLPLTLTETNAQTLELLDVLQNNAKRGTDLINQVLAFARGIEGERMVLQVRHLISEIKQIIRETFPKSITLQTELESDLWNVQGDATQLHQVLMNLSVNARDAMPDGGVLLISAQNLTLDEDYARLHLAANVGPYIMIGISDTGVGIAPEIEDKIFDPFFTTKELGKGTGLGLASVNSIVKNHGGFVEVYSELGQGTQFKVYLPAIEAQEELQDNDSGILQGQGEWVLLVDDEAPIRQITKTILENYNYRVQTAADGIEAIALFAKHTDEISVVLMDMMMPEMDGLTAIRTLLKMNPDIKIIVVSGLISSEKTTTAMATGCKTVLQKPYTSQMLLRALDEVLHSAENN